MKRPIDIRTKEPIEPAHKLEVYLEPDKFTEEKCVTSRTRNYSSLIDASRFALFENYQRIVHHESSSDITKSGFKRFLCSGFGQTTVNVGAKEKRVGSYHQCYRLDGKLVALGVLDLLPKAVSSVYLLYHESVHQFNFGKLSALYEIALSLEGGYQYYYMGR